MVVRLLIGIMSFLWDQEPVDRRIWHRAVVAWIGAGRDKDGASARDRITRALYTELA